jgi:hypothetical protein
MAGDHHPHDIRNVRVAHVLCVGPAEIMEELPRNTGGLTGPLPRLPEVAHGFPAAVKDPRGVGWAFRCLIRAEALPLLDKNREFSFEGEGSPLAILRVRDSNFLSGPDSPARRQLAGGPAVE